MITTNGTNSITLTLSTGDKDTVNNMATPQLDIEQRRPYGTPSGNLIAAAADQPITINDTILPTFSSATYRNRLGRAHHYVQRGPGRRPSHDASKIHVRNTGQSSGGVTLSNSMITTNGTNSITFDPQHQRTPPL